MSNKEALQILRSKLLKHMTEPKPATTKCTTCGYLSQGNTEHSCLDILRAQVATEQQRVVYEQEMHNALHSVAKAAHDYYHNGASSTPLVTALEALKQKGWKA